MADVPLIENEEVVTPLLTCRFQLYDRCRIACDETTHKIGCSIPCHDAGHIETASGAICSKPSRDVPPHIHSGDDGVRSMAPVQRVRARPYLVCLERIACCASEGLVSADGDIGLSRISRWAFLTRDCKDRELTLQRRIYEVAIGTVQSNLIASNEELIDEIRRKDLGIPGDKVVLPVRAIGGIRSKRGSRKRTAGLVSIAKVDTRFVIDHMIDARNVLIEVVSAGDCESEIVGETWQIGQRWHKVEQLQRVRIDAARLNDIADDARRIHRIREMCRQRSKVACSFSCG